MAYAKLSTIHTPATGIPAPAGWGLQADDNFEALISPPRCRMHKTDAASISDSTDTVVNWNSEVYDKGYQGGGLWTGGAPSRLTAPIAGLYTFSGGWMWAASTAGGRRMATLRVNAATQIVRHTDTGANTTAFDLCHALATDYEMAAGDYVELVVRQESGGPLAYADAATGRNFLTMRFVARTNS